ncbi:NAD(P)-dependent dehydrogenase (short-subunit alcohol dehydrogenase family) [Rhizobium petrolearium]|uniref:SDR family NAD(P)-dependent oxidoreductase n=1 Tax=Neorhizobium petrolearium TaxID=515361 RepID=UPI001AE1BA74|nr:SDR family NAD(P)-dependent oxidoreductase [Neorhizobium petrolearium]MBP1845757.1 NAD(P)-dependent dehydrogenase (short-subunit alcohol dehydrogenase family) [Neorhizobium petrolearium]
MKEIRFDGRTAIVTGAGTGLGRSHALGLAARGANVVVNDLGVATDGTIEGSQAARAVVEEIRAGGGNAISSGANVTDFDQVQAMVAEAIAAFGAVDILVNNAGILRDKTFAKMDMDDFRTVVDVHLIGSANCTKAVWNHMIEREYGRIVMTTSTSGLYGNFGQSNYGSAKAGVFGLMNVLAQEGARKNIRVNTLAPTAATRMTEGLLSQDVLELLGPETITPGLLALVCEDAPTKMILGAGAGCFAEIRIYETQGIALTGEQLSPEGVMASLAAIRSPEDQDVMENAFSQTRKYARMAAAARGLPLPWNEA